MLFKLSTVPQLAVAAAMLLAGVANAEQGFALRNSTLGVTTRRCGTTCSPNASGFNVAISTVRSGTVACCSTINLSFNGRSASATYTDDWVDAGPDFVALNDALYQALNPGGSGPFTVTWTH